MSTDSPATKPPPRRRRWLRRLVFLFLFGLLLGVGVGLYATAHLTQIAKWMLERTFPGARIEIKKLQIIFPNRLDADSITLKSRKDDATLLKLDAGSVAFDFIDLWHRQLGEVRLKNPIISASPKLMEAFAPPPGTPSKKEGAAWSVRHFVCDGGDLTITDYGVTGLSLHTKFCFDLQDFSPANAPDQLHKFILWDIQANAGSATPPLLTIVGCTISFSFADLNQHLLDEIALKQPVVSFSPSQVRALILPERKKDDEDTGPPWTIKHLATEYGMATLSDYGAPGLVITNKFSFDLKNLSTAQGSAKHTFSVWDFSAAYNHEEPFLSLDSVTVSSTLDGLLKEHRFEQVELLMGSLVVGKSLREIFNQPKSESSQPAIPWIIGLLDIRRVAIRLDDERPEVSDITFALNTKLQEIPLSETGSKVGSELQTIGVSGIDVLSPHDPLTKVLTINYLAVRFTLAGLLHKQIEELTISAPTIYVGEDLFWYMEDMEKRYGLSESGEAKPGEPGWSIKSLKVTNGRLNIGSGGRAQYGLPLNFHTEAQDVELDNLAALKLKGALEIPKQDYTFESYQLEVGSDGGQLQFDYPPETGKKNLVGQIGLSQVRWRQYKASQAWVAVTFDRQGINGTFGGNAYDGEMGGGFSFFFDPQSPWIGWFYGKSVDLAQLTDVISPKNFHMTGPASFKVQMDAQGKNIDRVLGEFHTKKPGKLVIGKLDALLADLPPTWSALKESTTRLALTTLRDFDYTTGTGHFWFVQSQGVLRLALQGPYGSRNFDVVLHTNDSPARWNELSKP